MRCLSVPVIIAAFLGFGLAQQGAKQPDSQPTSTDPHLLWKFETGG
jgi:hypothetical protein